MKKKKKLTPAQTVALELLKQNNKHGIMQTGTEHVLMRQRKSDTGRLFGKSTSVSNQTLLALKRRGLVYCVHLLPGSIPQAQRRRWHFQEQA